LHPWQDFKAPRCDRAEVLGQLGCQNESIYLRGASGFQVDSDLQFSDYVGKDFMKAVQLKPQKLQITLTPGLYILHNKKPVQFLKIYLQFVS
jgi:hypothetical protein